MSGRARPVSVAMAIFAAIGLLATLAAARPGGGDLFSGGGGGGGGGGDDGIFGLIFLLVELLIEFPRLAGPILVLIVLLLLYKGVRSLRRPERVDVGEVTVAPPPPPPQLASAPSSWDEIRAADPDFSQVLLEDFVYGLYAAAHCARHRRPILDRLEPYLTEEVRAHLHGRAEGGWRALAAVIGALSVVRVRRTDEEFHGAPPSDWVRLEIESNLVLTGVGGDATEYVREQWLLRRARGVTTRPWRGARSFDCPSCGAKATTWEQHQCPYCGERLLPGRFDWAVVGIDPLQIQTRPPALGTTTVEVGTDDPTLFAADVGSRWRELLADDPGLQGDTLGARLRLIYDELNRGWNAGDPALIRPFVADGQLQSLRYWIDAYRAQGLQNRLEEARLQSFVVAKVVRDKHYDAVTVRLFASGLDYTLKTRSGKVVAGSQTVARRYSEYWTLIRGAEVRGAPRAERRCPSCGADLKVGMSGQCEYCQAVIVRGDFDWVLSKIEQDESYRG